MLTLMYKAHLRYILNIYIFRTLYSAYYQKNIFKKCFNYRRTEFILFVISASMSTEGGEKAVTSSWIGTMSYF